MICNYRLGAKLLKKGSDTKLGRWSWMQFRGRQGTKVLVITAYQVSQTSARGLGMDTFYMQQWRKLAKMKTKINPRAQFWEDLTHFITTATADQAEVLLMLDANILTFKKIKDEVRRNLEINKSTTMAEYLSYMRY